MFFNLEINLEDKNMKKHNDHFGKCFAKKGINDLWTTRPDIAMLLLNPEDGYKLTKSSGRHVDFKCPNCGTKSNHILANVTRRGFSCTMCSDGISYPNKFMAAMLEQLNIRYKPEFTINGANYRYDFYLIDYHTIIEMHGRQHYENWARTQQTVEEIQQNDINKKDFAMCSDVKHYIVIDAKCSDINYISSKIKASYLSNICDLSKVDWLQCGYYASNSLVHKAAELYNDGYTIIEMSDIFKVDQCTIRGWLKKATELQLCNWVKNTGFLNAKHQVVLLNTKEQFDSMSDGGKKYNISIQNISKNCQKERAYAGIHPETNEPMVWRYIEDYDENEYIDFMSLLNPRAHYTTK